MGDRDPLRELHDAYVWEVNAAVGEGRPELVGRLADEFLDQALQLILGGASTGCDREDCAVCQRPRPARPRPGRSGPGRSRRGRRRWFRHARGAEAS